MARPRVRTAHQLHVYATNTTLGWRVIRNVSFADGEKRVEEGTFRRIYDQLNVHVGYQPLVNPFGDYGIRSEPSDTSITDAESQLNAGLEGKSQTAGLSEVDRELRIAGGKSPEDVLERATEKVRLWPFPAPGRGDRAIRVYPKATACKAR